MAFEKGFELGQYIQREVARVRCFLGANADIATATPLYSMDYQTGVTFERTSTRTYGMRGGSRGASFDGEREATLTIATQYFTMQHFAQMAGQSILEGAQDIFKVDKLKVGTGGVITLNKTPVNDDVAVLPFVNGMVKRRPQTVTSVSGREVTLSTTGDYAVQPGDTVEVYYQYNVPEAYSLNFLDRAISPVVTLVVDQFLVDHEEGVVVPAQQIFPRAQIRQDTTIEFASTGDPTSYEMVYDILITDIDGEPGTDKWIIYNDPDGDYDWIDIKYEDQQ